jgi:hypothetical protein
MGMVRSKEDAFNLTGKRRSTVDAQLQEYLAMAGILALWVVLPLIPAVLIYWLFPGTTVAASGPLHGLTVKASGAFAAYLIVFVVVIPWAIANYNAVGGWLHPAWTITGNVRVLDKHGAEIHPSDSFYQKICIRTQPEVNSFLDPTFSITIPEGQRGIPKIYLEVPDYHIKQPLTVHVSDVHNKIATIAGEWVEIREPSRQDSDDRQPQTDPARN